MTNREFYVAVMNAEVSEETKAFAENAITKMNEKNEKRKASQSPLQRENEKIKTQILNTMEANRVYISSEIAELLKISVYKVSALMRQLATIGKITTTDIQIVGRGKKKGHEIVQ